MAFCRVCGAVFQWGFCDGRWVPLEPIATHAGMDRTYIDEYGELRADHRDKHTGGASVNVTRLEQKVPATDIIEEEPEDGGFDDDDVSIGEAQDHLASEKGWFERMRRRA